MTSPLEAQVRPEANGARIVLSGRIDRDGDEALSAAYAEARTIGTGPLALDFTATDYINSTGIALIVRLLAEARRDGRTVHARGLTEHYREIFRITRLSDFMTIDDEATARPAAEGAAEGATA
jgi:anti-sigma B factor antagonist